MIRAGQLRHRVTIQKATETQDVSGDVVQTWGTHARPWVAVEGLSGVELFTARQTRAEAELKFHARNVNGVTPKMRILWGTRVFDITAVLDPDGRGRELTLVATEVV